MSEFAPVTQVQATSGERGSALLIVFLLAAMIAIMLYLELPVAVFEAQRQKENLLIDRGNEYAHAVKLFVRKTGTYPASLAALENTNNMRFLRHRFKDPFTGKDDWRLLHAGPGGLLLDSKVKQMSTGQTGNSNGSGPNSASGQGSFTANTGFSSFSTNTSSTPGTGSASSFGGNSSFAGGTNSNSNSAPEVVVPALPQRAPAVAANGSGQVAGPAGDQNPLTSLMPEQTETNQPNTSLLNASSGSSPGQTAGVGPEAGANTAGQNNAQTSTSASATNANTPATTATSNAPGAILGGGIAGVASKAGGHTIKVVNDQTNYSLWEFYYDPSKDAARGMASALGANGQQASPQQNGLGASGFFNNGNSTGNSSSFSTGSSSGTNNPSSAPPQSSVPPQTLPQQ